MSTYKEFRTQARKKRTKQLIGRIFIVILLIALFGLIAYASVNISVITEFFGLKEKPDNSKSEIIQPTEPPVVETTKEEIPYAFNGMVYDYPHMVTETVMLTPDYRMLALPATQKVDLSYFADAVFVGDSLEDGFRVYLRDQLPPTARYCTAKGFGPMSFFTSTWDIDGDKVQTNPLDDIGAVPAGKVYIHLGINSLQNNQDDEVILKYYAMLIDEVKLRPPTAVIYIQSVTPTTKAKSLELPAKFSYERIAGLNHRLAAIAKEKGVVFLDLHEVLEDGEGYLDTALCWPRPDGFHMAKAGYEKWLEYLTTHTVHSPANPYI